MQHGASTLPDGAFHNFPRVETAEIHLATGFQNMLYDLIPAALREEMYAWLRKNAAEERKAGDSDEQFIYKTRKKALGPFKEKLWAVGGDDAVALDRAFDQKFEFLFTQLAAGGTAAHVARFVTTAPMHRRPPSRVPVARPRRRMIRMPASESPEEKHHEKVRPCWSPCSPSVRVTGPSPSSTRRWSRCSRSRPRRTRC